MLWAASRGVWVSARPAHGWEAGRCFRLLISSAEGAASWAAARAGGRGGWSLAWRDVECSERLGVGWYFYICDVIVVLPLLGRTVSSATPLRLPAALPASPGKRCHGAESWSPRRDPPLALCKVYPFSTSPSLLGRTAQESRELGAGTAV